MSVASLGFIMKIPRWLARFWTLTRSAVFAFIFALNVACSWAQDVATLGQFTGAHTRVVWLQDQSPAANDALAMGKQLRLMKFDSQDDQGETPLLEELRNYSKPLLTPDGQRVVFSDQFTQKFLIINWNGTGRRVLGDGFAVDVWRDPRDGTDWIYVAKRIGKPEVAVYRNVRRIKLNDPKVSQKVWDQTDISCDNFQLSADGMRAGSDFPWPHGGVADLAKKTWKKLDQGCWASLAPDNSGLSWVLDGPHRHLQFHRPDQIEGWKVDISTAGHIKGAEVFHPRWSNHVRYLAITGPYQVQGKVNLISGGGPQVEILIGRFSTDFRSVEAWHQLTHNTAADFYPDVWIAGGETSAIELPGLKNPSLETRTEWPTVSQSLVFAWSNGASANQLEAGAERPGYSCKVTPHGAAVFGRYFDMRLMGGFFTLDDLKLPSSVSRAPDGVTLQMLVTPGALPMDLKTFCEAGPANKPVLQLSQSGSRLHWRLGTDQGHIEVPSWKSLKDANPTLHLGSVVTPTNIEIFLDGKRAGTFPLSAKSPAIQFDEIRLGSTGWRGHIEAVAIHSRNLSPNEVLRDCNSARQRLTTRKPAPQIGVQVKCVEPSSIPKPEQILPYRRALAVDVCEVMQIESPAMGIPMTGPGEPDLPLKPGDKILVARWVILDGQPLPGAIFKMGATAKFNLERLTDHRELESERQIIDTADIDLPVWYAVD